MTDLAPYQAPTTQGAPASGPVGITQLQDFFPTSQDNQIRSPSGWTYDDLDRRMKVVSRFNPGVTNDPNWAFQLADLPISDSSLADQSMTLAATMDLRRFVSAAQGLSAPEQRQMWGSLSRTQQRAAERLGWTPPGLDSGGIHLLAEVAGVAGKAFQTGLTPVNTILHEAGRLFDPLNEYVYEPIHRTYQAVRSTSVGSQLVAIGLGTAAGVGIAAGVAGAPFTGGASLAASGALTAGILGGIATAGGVSYMLDHEDFTSAWKLADNGERMILPDVKKRLVEQSSAIPGMAYIAEQLGYQRPYDLLQEFGGQRAATSETAITAAMNEVAGTYAEPRTPEYNNILTALTAMAQTDEFSKALQTFEAAKISPGRDIGRLVLGWMGQGKGDFGYDKISGLADAAFQIYADPLLIAGRASHAAMAVRKSIGYGADLDKAMSFAAITEKYSQDKAIRRAYDELAQAVSTGNWDWLMRNRPQQTGLFGPMRDWAERMVAEGGRMPQNGLDLLEFYRDSSNAESILRLQGRNITGKIELYSTNAFQARMSGIKDWGRTVLEEFDSAAWDRKIDKMVRRAEGLPTDVERATDAGEAISTQLKDGATRTADHAARAARSFLARARRANLILPTEVEQALQRQADRLTELAHTEQALTSSFPRTSTIANRIASAPFAGYVPRLAGGLGMTLLTNVPRSGVLHLARPEFLDDLHAFTELGRMVGIDPETRSIMRNLLATQTNAAGRLAGITGYLDLMFTMSGIRETTEGRALADKFLHLHLQNYGAGGLDVANLDDGLIRMGILPTKHQAWEVPIPRARELRKAVKLGTVWQAFLNTADAQVITNFMTKIWKPSVLLRVGFIPRAVADEIAAFMAVHGVGGYVNSFLARSAALSDPELRLSVVKTRVAEGVRSGVIDPIERAGMMQHAATIHDPVEAARWLRSEFNGRVLEQSMPRYMMMPDVEIGSSMRWLERLMLRYGGTEGPTFQTMREMTRYLRDSLQSGVLPNEYNTLPQWMKRHVIGKDTARRTVFFGVAPEVEKATKEFMAMRMSETMHEVSAVSGHSMPTELSTNDRIRWMATEVDPNTGEVTKRAAYIPVFGQRHIYQVGDQNQVLIREILGGQLQDLFDDEVLGPILIGHLQRYLSPDVAPELAHLGGYEGILDRLAALTEDPGEQRSAARFLSEALLDSDHVAIRRQRVNLQFEHGPWMTQEFSPIYHQNSLGKSLTGDELARLAAAHAEANWAPMVGLLNDLQDLPVRARSWVAMALHRHVDPATITGSFDEVLNGLRTDLEAGLTTGHGQLFGRTQRSSTMTREGNLVTGVAPEGTMAVWAPAVEGRVASTLAQMNGNQLIDLVNNPKVKAILGATGRPEEAAWYFHRFVDQLAAAGPERIHSLLGIAGFNDYGMVPLGITAIDDPAMANAIGKALSTVTDDASTVVGRLYVDENLRNLTVKKGNPVVGDPIVYSRWWDQAERNVAQEGMTLTRPATRPGVDPVVWPIHESALPRWEIAGYDTASGVGPRSYEEQVAMQQVPDLMTLVNQRISGGLREGGPDLLDKLRRTRPHVRFEIEGLPEISRSTTKRLYAVRAVGEQVPTRFTTDLQQVEAMVGGVEGSGKVAELVYLDVPHGHDSIFRRQAEDRGRLDVSDRYVPVRTAQTAKVVPDRANNPLFARQTAEKAFALMQPGSVMWEVVTPRLLDASEEHLGEAAAKALRFDGGPKMTRAHSNDYLDVPKEALPSQVWGAAYRLVNEQSRFERFKQYGFRAVGHAIDATIRTPAMTHHFITAHRAVDASAAWLRREENWGSQAERQLPTRGLRADYPRAVIDKALTPAEAMLSDSVDTILAHRAVADHLEGLPQFTGLSRDQYDILVNDVLAAAQTAGVDTGDLLDRWDKTWVNDQRQPSYHLSLREAGLESDPVSEAFQKFHDELLDVASKTVDQGRKTVEVAVDQARSRIEAQAAQARAKGVLFDTYGTDPVLAVAGGADREVVASPAVRQNLGAFATDLRGALVQAGADTGPADALLEALGRDDFDPFRAVISGSAARPTNLPALTALRPAEGDRGWLLHVSVADEANGRALADRLRGVDVHARYYADTGTVTIRAGSHANAEALSRYVTDSSGIALRDTSLQDTASHRPFGRGVQGEFRDEAGWRRSIAGDATYHGAPVDAAGLDFTAQPQGMIDGYTSFERDLDLRPDVAALYGPVGDEVAARRLTSGEARKSWMEDYAARQPKIQAPIDPRGAHWQLTINADPRTAEDLKTYLSIVAPKAKVGEAVGRPVTIDVGSREAADELAQHLHQRFGSHLDKPTSHMVDGDTVMAGSVRGRFQGGRTTKGLSETTRDGLPLVPRDAEVMAGDGRVLPDDVVLGKPVPNWLNDQVVRREHEAERARLAGALPTMTPQEATAARQRMAALDAGIALRSRRTEVTDLLDTVHGRISTLTAQASEMDSRIRAIEADLPVRRQTQQYLEEKIAERDALIQAKNEKYSELEAAKQFASRLERSDEMDALMQATAWKMRGVTIDDPNAFTALEKGELLDASLRRVDDELASGMISREERDQYVEHALAERERLANEANANFVGYSSEQLRFAADAPVARRLQEQRTMYDGEVARLTSDTPGRTLVVTNLDGEAETLHGVAEWDLSNSDHLRVTMLDGTEQDFGTVYGAGEVPVTDQDRVQQLADALAARHGIEVRYTTAVDGYLERLLAPERGPEISVYRNGLRPDEQRQLLDAQLRLLNAGDEREAFAALSEHLTDPAAKAEAIARVRDYDSGQWRAEIQRQIDELTRTGAIRMNMLPGTVLGSRPLVPAGKTGYLRYGPPRTGPFGLDDEAEAKLLALKTEHQALAVKTADLQAKIEAGHQSPGVVTRWRNALARHEDRMATVAGQWESMVKGAVGDMGMYNVDALGRVVDSGAARREADRLQREIEDIDTRLGHIRYQLDRHYDSGIGADVLEAQLPALYDAREHLVSERNAQIGRIDAIAPEVIPPQGAMATPPLNGRTTRAVEEQLRRNALSVVLNDEKAGKRYLGAEMWARRNERLQVVANEGGVWNEVDELANGYRRPTEMPLQERGAALDQIRRWRARPTMVSGEARQAAERAQSMERVRSVLGRLGATGEVKALDDLSVLERALGSYDGLRTGWERELGAAQGQAETVANNVTVARERRVTPEMQAEAAKADARGKAERALATYDVSQLPPLAEGTTRLWRIDGYQPVNGRTGWAWGEWDPEMAGAAGGLVYTSDGLSAIDMAGDALANGVRPTLSYVDVPTDALPTYATQRTVTDLADRSLPAVQDGYVRLYRGEYAPGGQVATPATGAPDWIKSHPEIQARKTVEGRWFTTEPDLAGRYPVNMEPGEVNRVVYVDVPQEVYDKVRGLADQPASVKALSKAPGAEVVLPPEWAGRAVEVPVAKPGGAMVRDTGGGFSHEFRMPQAYVDQARPVPYRPVRQTEGNLQSIGRMLGARQGYSELDQEVFKTVLAHAGVIDKDATWEEAMQAWVGGGAKVEGAVALAHEDLLRRIDQGAKVPDALVEAYARFQRNRWAPDLSVMGDHLDVLNQALINLYAPGAGLLPRWAEAIQADPSLSAWAPSLLQDEHRYGRNLQQTVNSIALQRAERYTRPLIDDPTVRSQFQEYVNNILPFWYAEQNFIKRWARVVRVRPETIRKAQLLYGGLKASGVVQQDPNTGDDIFVYPGSQALMDVLDKVPFLGNLMPADARLVGQVRYSIPGLDQVGVPGFGPVAQLPLRAITQVFPELEPFNAAVAGPRGTHQPWINVLVPASVRRFVEALSPGDVNGKLTNATVTAMQVLESSGHGLDPAASPEEQEVWIDRVRQHARILLTGQAIMGFVGPAAPAIQQGSAKARDLSSQLRFYVDRMGYEEGLNAFLMRFPDAMLDDAFNPIPMTVSKTERTTAAPLPTTAKAMAFYDVNRSYIADMPDAGTWLLPPPKPGEELADNPDLFSEQLAAKLRRRRTPEEFLKSLRFRDGAAGYFPALSDYQRRRTELRAQLDQAKASGAVVDESPIKALDADWDAWRLRYRATHPSFASTLDESDAPAYRTRVLDQMRTILQDPGAPQPWHLPEIGALVSAYDNWDTRTKELGSSRSEDVNSVRGWLKQDFLEWASRFVQAHPEIEPFWRTIIEPEVAF